MSVIATSYNNFSRVVKFEQSPEKAICRDAVVINDLAATLPVGQVMGKVTATGKWKVCLTAAVDGSQNPAGVLICDGLGLAQPVVVAASTDTNAVLLTRGSAIVADNALTLGAAGVGGPTLAAVKAAFLALNDPILVETQI